MHTCSSLPMVRRSAGAAQRLTLQAAGLILGSGAVAGEEPCQGGLGVVGGHADGVVDALSLVVVYQAVGVRLALLVPASASLSSVHIPFASSLV